MSALARAARWRAATPRLLMAPALEAGFALIALLLYSQALLGPLFADPAEPDGGAVLRVIWPPVYLVTLALAAVRPLEIAAVAARAWPLIALSALTLVSAAWSLDAELTVRRSIALIFTTLFALWIASRFSWRDLIRLIAAAFAVLAAASLAAGAAAPGFAVMSEVHPGAWKGLWWEKNTLGAMMAWAVLAFTAAGTLDLRHAMLWRMLVPLALLLVVLSTSKTALLASLVALGGSGMIAMVRRGFGFAALAFFIGASGMSALGFVLFIGPGVILEALGRDPTLTGRTEIWNALVGQILAQPWTGYGYGAFWETEGGPAHWVRLATAWDVPTAHNAWLETALALGVPGAGLALWIFAGALTRAAARLFSGREVWWALPFFVMWGGISLSESNLLQQNSLVWVLFAATAAKLAQPRGSAAALP